MTLDPLLQLPGVREAVERARVACEELRWHEAYRRRWREVRAEAGLRSVRASAELEGARVPLSVVRALATGGLSHGLSDDEPVVAGALRAAVVVEELMPALGARGAAALPPFGQLLARVHAAATGGWLPAEHVGRLRVDLPPADLTGLGPALVGDALAARVDLLSSTVAASEAPALVVAAVVHAELLTLRPFRAGNGVVARSMARLLQTTRGLDPTGSLIESWSVNPYLGAAAGFATGTHPGVAGWIEACSAAAVAGAARARAVADGVLAGALPQD
ncbi:Fic family protein [Cellulomonas sp. URHD0024]|uniref:Fic family protein n=1 Tax=Cellulomonas sp. URHD0024 TaxID=1302620 RepID=UPI0003F51127|nr:Fic family protein [Cellulomonas sp. URHD0024]